MPSVDIYKISTSHTVEVPTEMQWKDKRQELQDAKWEIPIGHEEKLLITVVPGLEQNVQKCGETPYFEVLKAQLGRALSNLIEFPSCPASKQEFGLWSSFQPKSSHNSRNFGVHIKI